MRVTDGFRAFVLEQLADLESVRARAMFGGVGLYAGDVFFGLVAADALYLKGTIATASNTKLKA
jgi:DNA transformation protein